LDILNVQNNICTQSQFLERLRIYKEISIWCQYKLNIIDNIPYNCAFKIYYKSHTRFLRFYLPLYFIIHIVKFDPVYICRDNHNFLCVVRYLFVTFVVVSSISLYTRRRIFAVATGRLYANELYTTNSIRVRLQYTRYIVSFFFPPSTGPTRNRVSFRNSTCTTCCPTR